MVTGLSSVVYIRDSFKVNINVLYISWKSFRVQVDDSILLQEADEEQLRDRAAAEEYAQTQSDSISRSEVTTPVSEVRVQIDDDTMDVPQQEIEVNCLQDNWIIIKSYK